MQNRRQFIISSAFAAGALKINATESLSSKGFKRLVCLSSPFGMIPEHFYPKEEGPINNMPKSLRSLSKFKDKLTIFSNLDHGFVGGHFPGLSVFNGVLLNQIKGMPDGALSIDQKFASQIGHLTRSSYLNIKLGNEIGGRDGAFYSKSGIEIPSLHSPQEVYSSLFLPKNKEEVRQEIKRLKKQKKLLEHIQKDAGSIKKELSSHDNAKIDEFYLGISELKEKINLRAYWETQPMPKVNYSLKDHPYEFTRTSKSNMDLIGLAFKTDTTRIVGLKVTGGRPCTGGIDINYHKASHHGNREEIKQILQDYEEKQFNVIGHLVNYLQNTKDDFNKGSLLDNTLILFASGMSNPSAHSNKNLPVMMIGGGLKHLGYKKCKDKNLNNLYLSILQYLGVNTPKFGHSTGPFAEMDLT